MVLESPSTLMNHVLIGREKCDRDLASTFSMLNINTQTTKAIQRSSEHPITNISLSEQEHQLYITSFLYGPRTKAFCSSLGIEGALLKESVHLFIENVRKSNTNIKIEQTDLVELYKSCSRREHEQILNESGKEFFEKHVLCCYFEHFKVIFASRNSVIVQHPALYKYFKTKALLEFSSFENTFLSTRELKRDIILHVGPTNSGKTYHALKQLENSTLNDQSKKLKSLYCGPLRLLAHEVYATYLNKGIYCDLVTGEEQILHPTKKASITASTVEMVDISKEYDVVVIDEIQVIENNERGWAWTRAFLGLKAKKIYLCGEESSIPLIQKMCYKTQDNLIIKYFDRLKPLQVEKKTIGLDFSDLREGDCLVAFSRNYIFDLMEIVRKSQLSKSKTQRLKCAVVYGKLPVENRSEQAKRFNDPLDKTKILIASDAIGMGLNLNIKRVIFTTTKKFNGKNLCSISNSLIKQIAGRAGRYGSDCESGKILSTSLYYIKHIKDALNTREKDIQKAGIRPDLALITKVADQLKSQNITDLLLSISALANTGKDYFLCISKTYFKISPILDELSMTLKDKILFLYAPWPSPKSWTFEVMSKFAQDHSLQKSISIVPYIDDVRISKSEKIEHLPYLEECHSLIMAYLWLNLRFNETFNKLSETINVKTSLELAINRILESDQDY